MTDKYCPQGEIKKLEIELWNLKVKGNYVPAYTERFQELTDGQKLDSPPKRIAGQTDSKISQYRNTARTPNQLPRSPPNLAKN
ncbi:hypothetical protein Tco_0529415 [Tanacetum coccineum]